MSSIKGLQLEHDSLIPVQEHFDALTQKVTLGFVLVGILTFAFMTKIDVLLESLLIHLNPCDDSSCLVLYEPASWSVVRWLSAVFLSILLILPIALYSMCSFASPGLTNREARMFNRWTLLSAISAYISLFVLFYFLIPLIYEFGDKIHRDMNLETKYDAIALFTFALSIFWAILITYVIAFATMTAGALGLVTESNQDWWRTRILGIGAIVMWLSLPGGWNGINIALVSVMILILEGSIRRSVRATGDVLTLRPMFDHEGRRRLILYVGISDNDEDFMLQNLPENTAFLRCNSLANNITERDRIVDTVVSYRITDTIVIGCDESQLPSSFKSVITSANCSMWFLQDGDDESIVMLQKRILGPNNLPNN